MNKTIVTSTSSYDDGPMIDRRDFLNLGPALFGMCWGSTAQGATKSQDGGILRPIPEPHFPSRLYQFVWRNWELANTLQMAKVIKTSQQNVLELGYAMGIPKKRERRLDPSRIEYFSPLKGLSGAWGRVGDTAEKPRRSNPTCQAFWGEGLSLS
jgi:hypothetical protein